MNLHLASQAQKAKNRATNSGAIAMVCAVAILASAIGIGNDFAGDDLQLIASNSRVQDFSHWQEWFTLPFWPPPYSPDLYRPLTSAFLAMQYVLGAGSPAVFRVVSYLLYAASSVGVLILGKRMLPENFATAAALLFAAHPVHVEAVALAVGQSELLVGTIGLAMCVFYLDRRRADRLDWRTWFVLMCLYLVACLTKEHGLVLPALLLVTELCLITEPLGRRRRALASGYAAFVVVAMCVLLVRERVLGGFAGSFTAEALVGLDLRGRALTMLRVVPEWSRLLLWPAHLRADYSPQEIVASTSFGGMETCGLLIIAAAAFVFLRFRRHAPAVSFGIGWCAVALLPVSNVVVPTGIVLAERTLFMPSVGVALTIAGIAEMLASVRRGQPYRRALAVACGVLIALGIGRSVERHRVWRNEGFFVARGVQDAPHSFRMQESYGDLLFGVEQPQLAVVAYGRAIRYSPPSLRWRVRNDLARQFRERGETAAEAAQLRSSLEQRPDQDVTRGELIVAYLLLGSYGEARSEADSAIAHGASTTIFGRVRALADSAERVHARVGSVKVAILEGAVTASP